MLWKNFHPCKTNTPSTGHRRRLLLKARRDIGVQRLLGEWLAKVAVPGNVWVQVDVDPVGFL